MQEFLRPSSNESLPEDVGFQPEVIPEGAPDSELVDFFMEHLSMPKPAGISEHYHAAELLYYRRQAEDALSEIGDADQREKLRKFLSNE